MSERTVFSVIIALFVAMIIFMIAGAICMTYDVFVYGHDYNINEQITVK